MEAVEAALEDVDPTTDALRAAVGKKRLEGLRGKMETRARAEDARRRAEREEASKEARRRVRDASVSSVAVRGVRRRR